MVMRVTRALALGVALATSACAMSHEMGTVVQGARCPGDGQASEVRWVRPAHPSDQGNLSAWCDVVGPPAILAEAGGASGAGAGVAESPGLIVVTWNVWVGGGDLEEFMGEELGLRCDVPRSDLGLTHFVILLQEAFRRGPMIPNVPANAPLSWGIHPDVPIHQDTDVEDVARRCGLALAYFPSSRNGAEGADGQGEDKGNAILSSLPLRDIAGVELPYEAGRKVGVAATVDVPGPGGGTVPLAVASVHLDVASSLVRTLRTANQTRQRQVRGFLQGLETLGFGQGPMVVGGDFNTWASKDGSLKEMRAHFPDSPPLTPEPTRGPFSTDHVFLRVGAAAEPPFRMEPDTYRVIQELYGSDHHARLLRLVVGR